MRWLLGFHASYVTFGKMNSVLDKDWLPHLLVSYPRSGSNFVQNVLRKSSLTENQSLYAPVEGKIRNILTLKSHAFSLRYLKAELKDYLGIKDLHRKRFVILFRDPRDVMISFYEYVRERRNEDINQADFLEKTDFFYASMMEKDIKNRLYTREISVSKAYQMFVSNWFNASSDLLDLYKIVRYEDVVNDPIFEFKEMLQFLKSPCEVNEVAVCEHVSLYSTESRPRGEVYGWKKVKEQYAPLISSTEAYLSKELEILGYWQ